MTLEYSPPITPLCSIRRIQTNSVIVAWPASLTGFELEQASNLNPPNWSNVGTPAVTVGEEKEIVVPLIVGSQFYRLKRH